MHVIALSELATCPLWNKYEGISKTMIIQLIPRLQVFKHTTLSCPRNELSNSIHRFFFCFEHRDSSWSILPGNCYDHPDTWKRELVCRAQTVLLVRFPTYLC